jgi:hypothetical protein
MKKSNVSGVVLSVWHKPDTWYVTFERNGICKHYSKASFHSIQRLTHLVNKLVFERKGVLYPTTTGWVCVITMKQ